MARSLPTGTGLLTWNEAVNLIMEEPPRIPTLEIGIRLSDTAKLRKTWNEARRALARDEAHAEELEGWPVDDLDEFIRRLTRLPLAGTADRNEIATLCHTAGERFVHWLNYDRNYQQAQSAILAETRRNGLEVLACQSSARGATPFQMTATQIAADIKVDMDRRHLVPDRYGEAYPRLSDAPTGTTAYYNAKITTLSLKDKMPEIRRAYRQLASSRRAAPRLSAGTELDYFYTNYVAWFKEANISPTEEQLTWALHVEWPEHTHHRAAARELTRRLWPRPTGRPKSATPPTL